MSKQSQPQENLKLFRSDDHQEKYLRQTFLMHNSTTAIKESSSWSKRKTIKAWRNCSTDKKLLQPRNSLKLSNRLVTLNCFVDYVLICCILHIVTNAFTVNVNYHKCCWCHDSRLLAKTWAWRNCDYHVQL